MLKESGALGESIVRDFLELTCRCTDVILSSDKFDEEKDGEGIDAFGNPFKFEVKTECLFDKENCFTVNIGHDAKRNQNTKILNVQRLFFVRVPWIRLNEEFITIYEYLPVPLRKDALKRRGSVYTGDDMRRNAAFGLEDMVSSYVLECSETAAKLKALYQEERTKYGR